MDPGSQSGSKLLIITTLCCVAFRDRHLRIQGCPALLHGREVLSTLAGLPITCFIPLNQKLAGFSCKGQIINILGFWGLTISAINYHSTSKAAIVSM